MAGPVAEPTGAAGRHIPQPPVPGDERRAWLVTPGHILIFDLAGTSYSVHKNLDGAHAVVCQDDSGVSTPAEGAPAPDAQMQTGAYLTTQEYAEVLEEAFSGRDAEIEAAGVALFGDPPRRRRAGADRLAAGSRILLGRGCGVHEPVRGNHPGNRHGLLP